MEIYNETVTDLLVDSWKRKPLEIRETINVRGKVGTVDRIVPTVIYIHYLMRKLCLKRNLLIILFCINECNQLFTLIRGFLL